MSQAPATDEEKKAALENIRKMFRLTMLANFKKPDESVDACKVRLAADPNTHALAARLKCTVDELLQNFGKDEQLQATPGYNHAAESARVKAVLEAAASAAPAVVEGEFAEDRAKDKSGTQLGVLHAPRAGEQKASIVTSDDKAAALLKSQLQQVRSMGSGTGRKKEEEKEPAAARGKPAPAAPARGGVPKGRVPPGKR